MAQQPADPFSVWREWISQSEQQWNSLLNEAMATDQFSQSMGQFMDVYLTMQRNMNDVLGRYFSTLNLASRTDILSINDRLSDIEAKLTAIQAELARPAKATDAATGQDAPRTKRPPRTKKPGGKKSASG